MERTHEEMKVLLGAYVLGALAEDEQREVRAHVLECEECTIEADAYMQATDALATIVPPEPLPNGFADAVLRRVGRTPERRAATRLSRRWTLAAVAISAATSIAAIVLAVFLVDARNDLQTNQEVLAALIQGNEGIDLSGEGRAAATLVRVQDGAKLVIADLTEAPSGKTYQLWFLDESPEPVSAGTFDASGDLFVFETDLSPAGFTDAAVTIEPRGGSRAPTGRMVLTST